jgi:hypothetical protein
MTNKKIYLQILEDFGKYWLYQYCRHWKIIENTGCTSIADTGRFWKILVIPILQTLEDSGKYWLYQYCRYWKILVIPVLQILENTQNLPVSTILVFWQ